MRGSTASYILEHLKYIFTLSEMLLVSNYVFGSNLLFLFMSVSSQLLLCFICHH